jgi:hypothetical protein
MTSHTPAGFYGLTPPPDVDLEILLFEKDDLKWLLAEVSQFIADKDGSNEDEFVSAAGSEELDEYFGNLSEKDQIAFIRWIAEHLS